MLPNFNIMKPTIPLWNLWQMNAIYTSGKTLT